MEDEKNYIISVKGGGKNREIRMSSALFRFGLFSLFVGFVIFIVACSYSVYSALNYQKNAEAIAEMQEATAMQQEQILAIAKKASELSDTLQNLARIEEELRLQAGLKPPKPDVEEIPENPDAEENNSTPAENKPATENKPTPAENKPATTPEGKPNGQGGPFETLNTENVAEALAMIEERVIIRQESIEDFANELKIQHAQLAINSDTKKNNPQSKIQINDIDLTDIAKNIPSNDPNTPSIWPTVGTVSSPYGLRWEGKEFHSGIDIANEMGTDIVATADGVVEYAGWNDGGYGNMVDINHGNGLMTRYGHASQVLVAEGQEVKRGQVIAKMGSTGNSTGPHVHYEVHVDGQRVNPVSYL